MNAEEILIKLGLDATSLGSGLRAGGEEVKHWVADMRRSLNEVFTSFAAPLSVAGIVATLDKVGQTVKRIKAESTAVGVSTDFLQDIENVGKAAGLSGEMIDGMLDKFVRKLPAGSDVEKSFFALADRLAAIPDPAERARAAIEAFGRSGVQMLKIVEGGSAGIKNLAGQFSKFGEDDIKAIEQANLQIEQTENRVTILTGKLVGFMATLAQLAGTVATRGALSPIDQAAEEGTEAGRAAYKAEQAKKATDAAAAAANDIIKGRDALAAYQQHGEDEELKHGTPEQKLAILQRRLLNERGNQTSASSAEDYWKAESKILDFTYEIKAVQTEMQKAQEEADSKTQEAAEKKKHTEEEIAAKRKQAEVEIARAREEVGYLTQEKSEHDSAFPTIDELAKSGMWGNWAGGKNAQDARRIEFLERDEKLARGKGNIGFAEGEKGERLSLTQGLQERGAIRPDHYLESIDKRLDDLNAALKTGTAKVQVGNGD